MHTYSIFGLLFINDGRAFLGQFVKYITVLVFYFLPPFFDLE
jgi:hypothetical protein